MRQRFCTICRNWHELDKIPVECWEAKASISHARSTLAFPMINTSDSTEPLVSMADGKTYTSKRAMRESYKAANNPRGQDFIEVGDAPEYITPSLRKPMEPKKEDFQVAIEKAEAAINRGEFQDIA